ncbi:MAG: DUF6755 family protein [Capsulimonas sp.]|uniref:DUF6755 family protein n=1 Tax=Capsulimonas sp. TaxID=2494211 RepID=UPI00326421C3
MNKMEKDVRSAQRTQAIGVVMIFIIVILLMQLWLLTIASEEFLAGHRAMALPTFLASAGCLLVNLWLLRYVNKIDRDSGLE